MAPLGEVVRPPYRPEPGRGRGRPPLPRREEPLPEPPTPLPPLTPIERRHFDYSGLEAAMSHLNQVLRQTRRALDAMAPAQTAESHWAGGAGN